MFRIVCDPSSGSTELYLTEITLSVSQIFFVCLVGVSQRNFEPAVCVHGTDGTVHVSVNFFAHHQEFSTVHSALVSFMQVFDDRFQAESGWNCSAVPS